MTLGFENEAKWRKKEMCLDIHWDCLGKVVVQDSRYARIIANAIHTLTAMVSFSIQREQY
jgi:hypothetical protein